MRRVVKPFAVEVRSSGRRSKSQLPAGPSWPQLDEQPDVVWPEITPVAAHEDAGTRPVGWLPVALPPAAIEPYRDPRKPPPIRFVEARVFPLTAPQTVEAAAPADKPVGRVLPDLTEMSVVSEAPLVERKPARSVARVRRLKPTLQAEAIADEPATLPRLEVNTKAIAATIVLRQGRDRLTRDHFKRGQRWKSRLPAAVHRVKSRQRLP